MHYFFVSVLLTTAVLFFSRLHAQVAIQLQVPPSGLLQKNQLWNMVVINAGGEASVIQIELNIYDARNSTRVLTAISSPVTVAPGSKQLNLSTFMPVQYQYLNPMYQVDAGQNGFLNVGIYKVCYSLLNASIKNSDPVIEECREIEVMPLSPPLLTSPADGAVLKEKYLQFTWMPPAPLQSFKNLFYEIKVVALQPGQNSSEAIQKNFPFAVKSNIRETFFNYPSSLPAFDTSSFYAWQVTAFDINGYSVKSEIWVFSLEKSKYSNLKVTTAYVKLKKEEDGSMFLSNGRIKFMYENLLQDTECSYQLISTAGSEERIIKKGKIDITQGENFIIIDLTEKRFWKENEVYRFELQNSKGEKWKLFVMFLNKEEEQQ